MSKISSTLEMIDKSISVINRNIHAVDDMINTMHKANGVADNVDIASPIAEAAKEAQRCQDYVSRLGDEIDDLGTSTTPSKLATGFGGLSKAIVIANQGLQLLQQGYQSLNNVMTKVDDRTSTDARLSLMRDELNTQDQLEAKIMAVSNASRSHYDTTADLVSKVGRQDYFKGNNDMAIRFADIINKGFVVSGASAEEMNSSIRQLTQGIASNTLRGEEFNSVMENAPLLAEMIAEQLDADKGKLREMAAEGQLSAEVVAGAILASGEDVDNMFEQMPQTFGQSTALINNRISALNDKLSQPGQAFDRINKKIQQFITWLDTANGSRFFLNIANAIDIAVNGLIWFVDLLAQGYNFVAENWTTIEPIFWGLVGVIGAATAAMVTYKIINTIAAAVQLAHATAVAVSTGAKIADVSATAAATAAQWGLNTALMACPIVWVITLIIAIIGVIIGLTIWIMKLWKTNLDFRIGVVSAWNTILDFFDRVPLFFILVGNGIIDAFEKAKVNSLLLMQLLVNGVITQVNQLITALNEIPGVEIETIEKVTFGTDAALEAEADRQARLDEYNRRVADVDQKAAEREAKLKADTEIWRDEIAKNESAFENFKLDKILPDYTYDGGAVDTYITGGGLDKEIDISNQSLEYLNDIAENKALHQFDAINAKMDVVADDAKLSAEDKDVLMSAAGATQKVYFLNYQGGVNMSNNINQGENWEDIKNRLKAETQAEIDVGISDLEEVLV